MILLSVTCSGTDLMLITRNLLLLLRNLVIVGIITLVLLLLLLVLCCCRMAIDFMVELWTLFNLRIVLMLTIRGIMILITRSNLFSNFSAIRTGLGVLREFQREYHYGTSAPGGWSSQTPYRANPMSRKYEQFYS